MARVVTEKEHDFETSQASRYPWHAWADGKQRYMERGVDFDSDLAEFEEEVYQYARQEGIAAKTEKNCSGLYVQFETTQVDVPGKSGADASASESTKIVDRLEKEHKRANRSKKRVDKLHSTGHDVQMIAEYSPHFPKFNKRRRPIGGYPWDKWMDGESHRLKKGKHYRTLTDSFMVSCYLKAKRNGLKCRSNSHPDGVTIQFCKP